MRLCSGGLVWIIFHIGGKRNILVGWVWDGLPSSPKAKKSESVFLGPNFPTGLFMGCRSALCGCNDKIHGGGVRGGNGFTYWLVGGVGIGVQEPNIYSRVSKIFLACVETR